jgi:hypothetical protein
MAEFGEILFSLEDKWVYLQVFVLIPMVHLMFLVLSLIVLQEPCGGLGMGHTQT